MNKKTHFLKLALCAGMVASMAALSGCEADGNINESGGIVDGGDGSIFPNDGTTGGNITEGGTPIAGGSTGFNFVCEAGAKAFGPTPTTDVVANGLVGGPLTLLLNLLGGNTLTQLLNSVTDKELAIDGDLESHSTFSLTVGLISGLLSSVDQRVILNGTVPSGNYAVFGVSFPTATLELSLLNQVTVRTFLNGVQQESASLSQSTLDLLGAVNVGTARAFVGVKTTQPYDTATVGITPGVLSANVGEAMFVHELCTKGRLVAAP